MSSLEKFSLQAVDSKLSALLAGGFMQDFVKLVRALGLREADPSEIVRRAVTELAFVIYRHRYESYVPHSFMALAASLEAGDFLEPHERMLPVIQALWYAGGESKLPPYRLPQKGHGKADFSAEGLDRLVRSGDTGAIFSALRESCSSQENFLALRDALISLALSDLAGLGHKLICLVKSFELIERWPETDAVALLFPSLHYFIFGPRDTEYFSILAGKLKRIEDRCSRFPSNSAALAEKEAERLEKVVLYQYPGLIIDNFVYALESRIALAELFQVTLSAAGMSLAMTYPESWIYPVHGYHFAHAAWECFRRISRERDRLYLPFMAALFVNKMAVKSLNPHRHSDRGTEDSAGEISLAGLERAIRDSKPELAASLVRKLMTEAQFSDLARTLILTASKNDASICLGHDLKLCAHVLSDHSHLPPSARLKTLSGLAHFLASVEKDYELYHLLGDGSPGATPS